MELILKEIQKLGQRMDDRFDQVDLKFAQIDTKFDDVYLRFDKIDARFNQVDTRLNQVDARFDQVDARFDQQDDLINSIAIQVNDNTNQLDNLTACYLSHDQRLNRIEQTIEQTMATKEDIRNIYKTLDWLVAKFTKFEQELLLLAHRSAIHTDQITILQNAR